MHLMEVKLFKYLNVSIGSLLCDVITYFENTPLAGVT